MEQPSVRTVAVRITPNGRRLIATLIVIGVALVSAYPVIGYDWLFFDDDINIFLNAHLGARAPFSFVWAFQDMEYTRRYLPLGWAGFVGLLGIDGYNASIFHAASWLLNGVAAALVFFLLEHLCLEQTARRQPAQPVDASPTIAAAVATVVWILHPLRVENIGWISGLLYLFGFVLTAAAVLLHLKSEAAARQSGRPSHVPRLAASLLYLAALLVYPIFLTVPALLVCWHTAMAPNRRARAALQSMRSLAAWWIAAGCIATFNTIAAVNASAVWTDPVAETSLVHRLQIAGNALVHYLSRTFWPGDVSVYYGDSALWPGEQRRMTVLIVLVAGALALGLSRRARNSALPWLVAAFLAIGPFIAQPAPSFHPSDRYAILWLVVGAAGLALLLASFRTATTRRAALIASLAIAMLFGVASQRALPNWKDTEALQASIDRALAQQPDPKLSFARPAVALWWLGKPDEAKRRLAAGQAMFPGADVLEEAEQLIRDLETNRCARLGQSSLIPPLAIAHVDLGRKWEARGEIDAATAHYLRALTLAPDFHEAFGAYRKIQSSEGR